MLKLNNNRIFMHMRYRKTQKNRCYLEKKGATVRVNVDKKVLVG